MQPVSASQCLLPSHLLGDTDMEHNGSWERVCYGRVSTDPGSYALQEKESRVMPQKKWKESKHMYRNMITTNENYTHKHIYKQQIKMNLLIKTNK